MNFDAEEYTNLKAADAYGQLTAIGKDRIAELEAIRKRRDEEDAEVTDTLNQLLSDNPGELDVSLALVIEIIRERIEFVAKAEGRK
jgi:hypothetical protein